MRALPQDRRRLLLSSETSRINKLHLVAHFWSEGYFVEYDWPNHKSRVRFVFEPGGIPVAASSHEEDVATRYEDPRKLR